MTDSVAIKRQHAWGRLYNAANAVAARVGADGEISARSPEISTLMDALADIDGGQWCPGIMPGAAARPAPVAWRHSSTGCLYETEGEVPHADGDEWAEPLYLAAPPQPVRLSDYDIWKNDVIMAANADIGLPMADLMRLVLAIEAAQTATPKGDAA